MLCNNSCEHVSFLRFSSKICLNIIEYLFKLFNSSWLFGGSSESQHSRPKFPYLSKRVLSDYRMLFHTKKNEASTNWRTAATIAGTVKMIRCGPPYGKRKHCCYWLKHWGKKKCTPQWLCLLEILPKHWEHFKDHLGIILSNLCFDMLKFGVYELRAPNLVDQLCHCLLLFPEDHRVMFQVPSKGKSLAISGWKNTCWLCVASQSCASSSPHPHPLCQSRRAEEYPSTWRELLKTKNPCSDAVCHWRPVTPFLSAKTPKTSVTKLWPEVREQILEHLLVSQANLGFKMGCCGGLEAADF